MLNWTPPFVALTAVSVSFAFKFIPKVFDWVEVFRDLAQGCTGAQSWWNSKGLSPDCKVGNIHLAEDDSLLVFHLLLKVNQPAEKVNLGELYCI